MNMYLVYKRILREKYLRACCNYTVENTEKLPIHLFTTKLPFNAFLL